MKQENLRLIVLEMLLTVTDNKNGGAYSHIVARDTLNKYNYLLQQEKSFIKRLFEGTLERLTELDFVIDAYSKTKTDKMKPVIRAILRLSVYQLLYMDAVPDAAACNEAVKLARKKGFLQLSGFVNGVLRTVARNKGQLEYPSLSVKYSMPEWIVGLWEEQLGKEKTLAVLEGLLAEHPVTIRLRKPSIADELKQTLARLGGGMERHPYLNYAYKITKTDDISLLPQYADGGFVVQDVSSMLALQATLSGGFLERFSAGEVLRAADVCAAPGGKTMLLADLLRAAGVPFYIEARDISENKVRRMMENFARCGFGSEEMSAEMCDAAEEDEEKRASADIVIADVPCSGLGVIGKKRDIKYRASKEQTAELVILQRRILRAAAKLLAPGGRLLFSTCTIDRAENEENFWWLREELKLTPVSFFDALPSGLTGAETAKEGFFQLLPGVHDADGFFIGVLERRED